MDLGSRIENCTGARGPRFGKARVWLRLLVGPALVAIVFGVLASALPRPGNGPSAPQGVRNAGVQPKRPNAGRTAKGGPVLGKGGPVLATADYDLVGFSVLVSPASQTVPKNQPTAVLTTVAGPDGGDLGTPGGLNPNYRVRGVLSGPSFPSPITVEAAIGEPISIPALTTTGFHLLGSLRIVDTTPGAGEPVVDWIPVDPTECTIEVVDNILVSEVRVRELSYDEITQSGIAITDDSYTFFDFALGLQTISNGQAIHIPVAFPPLGAPDPRPVAAPAIAPPEISQPQAVIPVMLEAETPDGGRRFNLDLNGAPIRIPGAVVIPGQIGLLHQFFEAVVIVSNGAPATASNTLVVHDLHATVKLPDNGTPNDPSDDPLRIPDTTSGQGLTNRQLFGLGEDGQAGTADDPDTFRPGQSGQASFTIEGLEEGLHTVTFCLEGTLEGLPIGPVTVKGEVPGSILVRDQRFTMAFTHPATVRAGQTYDLGVTLTNTSSAQTIHAARMALNANVSGAHLAPGQETERDFYEIAPGASKTVTWHFIADTTGMVTAAYTKLSDEIEGGLTLTTGVGDRNVPLSPDSLILPDTVRFLPPDVVEAGRALLGQAWSVATAPAGLLPPDIAPIERQTVVDRAVDLGIGGLRVEFGEPVDTSLETVVRDWLGETQTTPDPGFADAVRNTAAGYAWYDTVGHYFGERLASGQPPVDAAAWHRAFAEAEGPRSAFVSALVSQSSGTPVAGARLVDSAGHMVGFLASPGERAGDVPLGAALNLTSDVANATTAASRGQLLVASRVDNFPWNLDVTGWQTGTIDISVLVPTNGRNYRQAVFSNVPIAAGQRYRVTLRPFGAGSITLQVEQNGAFVDSSIAAAVTPIAEASPRLVGVLRVTPDVLEGGDKYGRIVGLLFSKPMSHAALVRGANYAIGGGQLAGGGDLVGRPIHVTGATGNFSDRFSFAALDGPVGPFVDRTVAITGMIDAHGLPISSAAPVPIVSTSPENPPAPAGYLTGRVLNGDGTPVAGATIAYKITTCVNSAAEVPSVVVIATQQTASDGTYAIDFVRNESQCGKPLTVDAVGPNGALKTGTLPVLYYGQHIVVDLVFLARGSVEGQIVRGDGTPAVNAQVQVVPALEPTAGQTVRADSVGHYRVDSVPVGDFTVLAVGGAGVDEVATGLAAGNLDAPGTTAIVNVALQPVSGEVHGHVFYADHAQTVRGYVLARAPLPGFGTYVVGYCYVEDDHRFALYGLPLGPIYLQVVDLAGSPVGPTVTVTPTAAVPRLDNVEIDLPSPGAIRGHVIDGAGNAVPAARVSVGATEVVADYFGAFEIPSVSSGQVVVRATDPISRFTGSTTVTVADGQTVEGVTVVIAQPSTITGRAMYQRNGTTAPLAGAAVSIGLGSVATDAYGYYRLPNVAGNRSYTLRVVHPNGRIAANVPIVVGLNATVTRDVTLHGASISGTVFAPDGVTPENATVTIRYTGPDTTYPDTYGLLSTKTATIQTSVSPAGTFRIDDVTPGGYSVRASSVMHPTAVWRGGTVAADETAVCNVVLVNQLFGTVHGHVSRPDGTPSTSATVTLNGGGFSDVNVHTDENGDYQFADVFGAGGYTLTATEPSTGYTVRTSISIRANEDTQIDLTLKGRGNIRVHVVDGGGTPVLAADVTVDGTDHPRDHRFAQLTQDLGGTTTLTNLAEGPYAISASYNGLSGRASAYVPNGDTVDVTVMVQASGSVAGRVFQPDGVTGAGLADVKLIRGGRVVGLVVTSDVPGEEGTFRFDGVPSGDFTVEALDNRTGRIGRAFGRIAAQDEVAQANITLVRTGTVSGTVTSNGQPVSHALVRVEAGERGFTFVSIQATTDNDGAFVVPGIPEGAFSVSASTTDGRTGGASGTLTGPIDQPIQASVAIAVTPSVAVTGIVREHDGVTPVAGASITLTSGTRNFYTTTDATGRYSLPYVSLGTISIRAKAPAGYDRGQAGPLVASEAGASLTLDAVLDGTGDLEGVATSNGTTPLAFGTVTFTNTLWPQAVTISVPVLADGHYMIHGAPVGDCSLRLTVPGDVRVGSTTATVVAGATQTANIQLEDAGTVRGTVLSPDGVTPARNADVTVKVVKPNGQRITFFANTATNGTFRVDNVPLGTVTVSVTDPVSAGVASASGELATAQATLDFGTLLLDNSPIQVVSVDPVDGATGVAVNATITVAFSEAARPSSVNGSTVRLLANGQTRPSTVSLSPDGTVVTLTPSGTLADTTTYTVSVTTGVTDALGHPLVEPFQSSFVTRDTTPPAVAAVSPVNGTIQVPLDSAVVVTFDEPLDPAQDLASIVTVATSAAPTVPIPGSVSLEASGTALRFAPSSALADSTIYTVRVTGQRDPSGNTASAVTTSTFVSLDVTPPVVAPFLSDGHTFYTQTVSIGTTYQDESSGIDLATLVVTLDGAVTTDYYASAADLHFQNSEPLPVGPHTIAVQIADRAGNLSAVRSATFTVDDEGPSILDFTIDGRPASDGMAINTTQRPVFSAYLGDNAGFRSSECKLLLGPAGGEVTAYDLVLTPAGGPYTARYQPAEDLEQGDYTVQLKAVDGLGNVSLTDAITISIGTTDVTPPSVVSVSPTGSDVPRDSAIVMTFDERIDPNQAFDFVAAVYARGDQLFGTYSLDATGRVLTFQPEDVLPNYSYGYVRIQGVRDLAGNSSTSVQSYEFFTTDSSAPVIDPFPATCATPLTRPTISTTVTEDGAGFGSGPFTVVVDGVPYETATVEFDYNTYNYRLSFTPDIPLAPGTHTISAQIADAYGNLSAPAEGVIVIDSSVTISQVTPATAVQHDRTRTIEILGTGLVSVGDGVSPGVAPEVLVGGNPATVVEFSACADRLVAIAPVGAPGPADVEVRTDHGTAVAAGAFTYTADPRTPFAVEPDTLLLWHFDDEINFPVHDKVNDETEPAPTDAGPLHLEIDTSIGQTRGEQVHGRFDLGVDQARLYAVDDGGALAFDSDGFTAECWMRTRTAGEALPGTFLVLGKTNGSPSSTAFALSILPSGILRAEAYDTAGTLWQFDTAQAFHDGAWHSLALVVERGAEPEQNVMTIYVDGAPAASSVAPLGFGAIRTTTSRFAVGSDFGGTIDEVRVSSTAHSAERIAALYEGADGPLTLEAHTATPLLVERGVPTTVVVGGYRLEHVTATITDADANPVAATAEVLGTAATFARVRVTIDESVPAGTTLVLHVSNGTDTGDVQLTAVTQGPFVSGPGTVLLWHLDEDSEGVYEFQPVDAGPNGISGTALGYGDHGRYGGAWAYLAATSDENPALSLSAGGFAAEGWFKIDPVNYVGLPTYLFAKGSASNPVADFSLEYEEAGTLRARVYDETGQLWEVSLSRLQGWVADNAWHQISMVVERGEVPEENRLVLYVDGTPRAESQAPAGFAAVRDSGHILSLNFVDDGDPEYQSQAWNIVTDEVRVLNFAPTAAEIWDQWTGAAQVAKHRVVQLDLGFASTRALLGLPPGPRPFTTLVLPAAPPRGGRLDDVEPFRIGFRQPLF